MSFKTFLLCLFLIQQTHAQSYRKIHEQAIVTDTHNDFLMQVTDSAILAYTKNTWAFDKDLKGKTHTDLYRQKEGGLDVQVFSVFCTGEMRAPFQFANRQIESLDAIIARNPGKIIKALNSTALINAVKQGKLVALIGVEGGHMIEDDLGKLEALYKRGARYLTLTWNNSTSWASSAFEETFKKDLAHKGLNELGKQVVRRMNELGMLVDISHVGEQTFWDVLQTTTKPVIASHSSVYALCHHQRNLKDEQIKAIAKNGGVIQVNFNPGFIDSSFDKKEKAFFERHQTAVDSMTKAGVDDWVLQYQLYHTYAAEANAIRPPLSLLIDHIEYIIRLVGVDHVGLGSDFDGITLTPQELDDVTALPQITKVLFERGYSKKDITKILGGNFIRVLQANEQGAGR